MLLLKIIRECTLDRIATAVVRCSASFTRSVVSRKFGLLTYENTGNLGDEIQSIAAKSFLPQIDYYIDREYVNKFSCEDSRNVALIMNGWFMHRPEHWPPSPKLLPHILSFHISDWQSETVGIGLRAVDTLVAEPVAKYLRAFAPIGARDLFTLDVLQRAGIDSYFSGCLTLTLNRPQVPPNEGLIVLNDVPQDVVNHVRAHSTKQVLLTAHSTFSNPDRNARFDEADRLLSLYASASCVITTRLHCAMPCLAFGTPVLLLDPNDKNRFSGLIDFLRSCSTQDYIAGHFLFDVNSPPPNFNTHGVYTNSLRRSVRRFVENVSQSNSGDPPFPLTQEEQLQVLHAIHERTVLKLKDERDRRIALEDQLSRQSN